MSSGRASPGDRGAVSGRLRRFGRAVLDVLFPEGGCAICGGPVAPAGDGPALAVGGPARAVGYGPNLPSWRDELCPTCLAGIEPASSRPRTAHGRPGPGTEDLPCPAAIYLDGVVTGGRYSGSLERAVLRLKRTPDRRLAATLAAVLTELLAARGAPPVFWGIVPVPLHPGRLRERGFNQSVLLGRELAALIAAPLRDRVCERVRPTGDQTALSRDERLANLVGAFRVGGGPRGESTIVPPGAPVLVVDDVVTTGATSAELARALKAAGAGVVWCAAIARAR